MFNLASETSNAHKKIQIGLEKSKLEIFKKLTSQLNWEISQEIDSQLLSGLSKVLTLF